MGAGNEREGGNKEMEQGMRGREGIKRWNRE